MSRRLSLLTSLAKYALPDPPRWRTHGGTFLFYNDALIFGGPVGAPFVALSHLVADGRDLLPSLTPAARRFITSRLATLNMTDAAAIAATNDTVPDVRIEYEDRDGRWEVEDLEIVTPHYRGAHAGANGRSGFQQHQTGGVRVGGRSGGGRGRPFDPRVADDILS